MTTLRSDAMTETVSSTERRWGPEVSPALKIPIDTRRAVSEDPAKVKPKQGSAERTEIGNNQPQQEGKVVLKKSPELGLMMVNLKEGTRVEGSVGFIISTALKKVGSRWIRRRCRGRT